MSSVSRHQRQTSFNHENGEAGVFLCTGREIATPDVGGHMATGLKPIHHLARLGGGPPRTYHEGLSLGGEGASQIAEPDFIVAGSRARDGDLSAVRLALVGR